MVRGTGRALVLALAGLAAHGTPAGAATVTTDGGRFAYAGAPGERNIASVTRTDVGFVVDDISVRDDGTAAPLQAGSGCVRLGTARALCTGGEGGFARLDGGDGHDTLTAVNQLAAEQRYELHGGDGSDELSGSTGIDLVHGGAGRDVLRGLDGGDVLDGAEGDDDLEGGAGDDRLDGGTGSDELDGGAGVDTVSWYRETRAVTVTLDDVRNDGVAGEDWVLEAEEAQGGAGDDVLTAGVGAAVLEGGAGADELTGGPEVDSLLGGDGDDRLAAGGGDDLLFGQSGADDLEAGDGADGLHGDRGADRLDGGTGDDDLSGGADDDRLLGGDGADLLLPGFGTDWLDGGLGADRLRGDGEGADTVSYADRSAPVAVTLAASPALIGDDGAAGEGDDLAGIEAVLGGAGGDRLTGTDADETLDGGAGTDTLSALGGDDALVGGADADALDAGDGDDRLHAVDRTRDTAACGAGADAAEVDPKDRTTACEAVIKVS